VRVWVGLEFAGGDPLTEPRDHIPNLDFAAHDAF